MIKTKIQKFKNGSVWQRLALFAMTFAFAGGFFASSLVAAATLNEQITRLREENARNSANVERLEDRAVSYEDAINQLTTEIAAIQRSIDKSEKEQKRLQQEIDKAERELEQQKSLLGQNIKSMYLEGQISTLEILASSNDLSEFVDKEQYRSSVEKQIKETLDRINQLRLQLKTQKDEVERLLREQIAQRDAQNKKRQKQQNLLAYSQAQIQDFNQKTEANEEKISELIQQQIAENCRIFGCSGGVLGGGGYTWGHAPCIHTGQVEGWCANYDWSMNGQIYNWNTGGWGYRNCTDWVAFRSGGSVPDASVMHIYTGSGHAKWWDDVGRAMGKRVSSSPRSGDTAVRNGGPYGHVMYVEQVHGNGSITVSDYNRAGTGKYDTSVFQKIDEGLYESPGGSSYSLVFVTW